MATNNSKSLGDEAIEIINRYRHDAEDNFRVEALECEFPSLSQELSMDNIFLARTGDNLTGAFKWRGALVGAIALQKQGAKSLVVPSAGNHARGAILAAKLLNMGIHVVVPETAPPAKKEGLKDLWHSSKLHIHTVGKSFDESLEWALAHPEYGELLHPYDNPHVAAGQGTIVDDIVKRICNVSDIVLPIGGGGLYAGVLNRARELGLDTTIHAAEASGSNSFSKSIASGKITTANNPNPRYGGSAVRQIGNHTLATYHKYPNNTCVITISDDEVMEVTKNYNKDLTVRRSTHNYEPTTIVAITGAARITRAHSTGNVVIIGTGHNDSLDLSQKA
jgi:threonine dehydratase